VYWSKERGRGKLNIVRGIEEEAAHSVSFPVGDVEPDGYLACEGDRRRQRGWGLEGPRPECEHTCAPPRGGSASPSRPMARPSMCRRIGTDELRKKSARWHYGVCTPFNTVSRYGRRPRMTISVPSYVRAPLRRDVKRHLGASTKKGLIKTSKEDKFNESLTAFRFW
jgi:hypothetical protein